MDILTDFDALQTLAVAYGVRFLISLAIFFMGRWAAHLLVEALKKVLTRARVDQTLVSFMGNLLYYTVLIIIIVTALSNLGLETTTVIAVMGGATLAIGFALQDSLSNLASGVILILLRPYQVGHLVEISGITGFVTEIEMFHTRLRTRDNKDVFIPNNDVLDGTITNYSRTELIRLDLTYGIGYGDDLLQAKRVLQQILADDERVIKDPPPVVAVQALGDSSVDLVVRPFVRVQHMVPVTFAITEQVKLRFDAEGISIPFPQRDVHVYQHNGKDGEE
ncbi:MAG: mechanosensitive ion channel [Chloroflexota bacterium]